MNTVWKLFRLQIDERIDIFKKGKKWKVILPILSYIVLIALISLALTYAFSWFIRIGLYADSNLLAILLLFTQILSFAIALGSIIKNLYNSKDNDLLMSLPCSHNQIFLSKLLVIYAFELIANTLYTAPIFIMFGIITSSSVGYYFMSILFLILLPLLSLVLAGFFSIPLIYIVNKLKKNTTIASICLVLCVAVILGLYMFLIISFTDTIDFSSNQYTILRNVNNLISQIATYTVVFKGMAEGMLMVTGWWWKDLILLCVIGIFLLFTLLIVRKTYFKLSMKNKEMAYKTTLKPKFNQTMGAFRSIIVKEAKTLFREPGNIFQYFIFTLLMPFIVLLYDKMLFSITVNQTGQAMIVASHVLVVAILAMLSNMISATAVSREGGNFYITKMAPTSPRKQMNAKIVFNLIFTYSSLIVTMIFTAIFTDISFVHNLLCTIAVAIISLGHIITSIFIDLKKPVLDWYDSNEIEKISKSTRYSMLLALAFAFVMFLIVVVFAPTKHTIWPWSILISVVSCYTILMVLLYHFKINRLYEKVEN